MEEEIERIESRAKTALANYYYDEFMYTLTKEYPDESNKRHILTYLSQKAIEYSNGDETIAKAIKIHKI